MPAVETASVARRPAVPGRAMALPAPLVARWGLAALVLGAVAGFFVYPTYPNYDSYYSLLWGRELVSLDTPSFVAYRAPTEHPLAIAFGALLAPLGEGADRLMVGVTLGALVALIAGVYRLARLAFTPLVALVAAAIMMTRFDFPYLAVRAYIDIPYIAVVLWAAILEYERPRRGLAVFGLLAAGGLMRPEAWVLAGLYLAWMAWPEVRRPPGAIAWRRLAGYAGLAAVGPAIWAAVDLAVTGDPLYSLHATSDLAGELGRQRSLADVPVALPEFFNRLVKPPVVLAGCAGILAGLWYVPTRIVMPAILLLSGVGTFAAVGLAGLSVIDRYLIVASVGLCVFAGLALGGFTMLRPGSRERRLWQAGSALAALFALAFTVLHNPSLTAFNRELAFRADSHRSLQALLGAEGVRGALARGCAPVSTPSHKIIPEVRWILDLPASAVIARSDPRRAARTRRGLAIYVQGRRTLIRQGFASNTQPLTQVPQPGFVRVATSRYYSAYARCRGV